MYNKQLLKKLAAYFAEHGLPESYQKFKSDGKKPVTDREMVHSIGGYLKMLSLFEKHHPEYWKLAQPIKDEPEPVKQDPLAALRASTVEK
jgi:hypothetical protein